MEDVKVATNFTTKGLQTDIPMNAMDLNNIIKITF